MTATYDLTPSGADYAQARPNLFKPGVRTEQKRIDFAADMAGASNAAGDYADIIKLGVGDAVTGVVWDVVTASTTAASTVNIGDSSSATAYKSALSTAATSWAGAAVTTLAPYATADAVRLTLGATAPKDGVVDISFFIGNVAACD